MVTVPKPTLHTVTLIQPNISVFNMRPADTLNVQVDAYVTLQRTIKGGTNGHYSDTEDGQLDQGWGCAHIVEGNPIRVTAQVYGDGPTDSLEQGLKWIRDKSTGLLKIRWDIKELLETKEVATAFFEYVDEHWRTEPGSLQSIYLTIGDRDLYHTVIDARDSILKPVQVQQSQQKSLF